MSKSNKSRNVDFLNSIVFSLIHWILGISIVIFTFQIYELIIAKSKSEYYSESLLDRVKDISTNINNALDYLNKNTSDYCGESLGVATYDFRFIEDAGRISGNIITCSAIRGDKKKPYVIDNNKIINSAPLTIWDNINDYAPTTIKMRIFAKNNSFVIVSPHAFAAYSPPPKDIYAIVETINKNTFYQKFGDKIKPGQFLSRTTRLCSTEINTCVQSTVSANIFEKINIKIALIYIIAGMAIGTIISKITKQLIKDKNSIKKRLLNAIKKEEIYINYQPIVLASTGEIQGFEALARWNDKKLGVIPPDIFIKEAKNINKQEKLSKIIIKKSILEISDILNENKNLYISLNLSAAEIISQDIIKFTLSLLKEKKINPYQVAIEILENSTSDLSKIETSIIQLKREGLKVFIDDFGSGYSSLSYLSRLNVDKIKIDRSFTNSLGTKSPALFVLSKVCEIAEKMNSSIIFEGIEYEQQRLDLMSLNPNSMAQGWLFSKPLDIHSIKKIIGKKLPFSG